MATLVSRIGKVSPLTIYNLRRRLTQAETDELREFLISDELPGDFHAQWMGATHNGYWRFAFSDARSAMMLALRFG